MTGAVGGILVDDAGIGSHARKLLARPVTIADLALSFPESTAVSTELLVGGTAFYPRMLADIEAATSSVHIIQFGFRPGRIGDRFADALAAKAASGVVVRVVVDRRGSDPEEHSRDMYARLVAAGAHVHVVSATTPRTRVGGLGSDGPARWSLDGLGHFDHRKICVVDGEVGWVGGAGIEDHFEDGRFHDMFVRTTGPVVRQFQLVFVASFRWMGGTVPVDEIDTLFPVAAAGEIPAVVLHNAPGRWRPITTAIGETIDSATTTLDISNPYVSDRRMIGRIAAAARRGVTVRLFVPANANNWACAGAQQFHHGALLDAGVAIVEYPTMLHAKAFVRDGRDVLIGTCNLDAWSLKRFLEIDIRVQSEELAAQFDERFARPASEISGLGERIRGTRRRARNAVLAVISPVL